MRELDWHLGDVVRKLREQRRWNQQRLAEAAGVNKATIVRVEEGGNSKRETLAAVAAALGVSLGELFRLLPETDAYGPWNGVERRSGRDRRRNPRPDVVMRIDESSR